MKPLRSLLSKVAGMDSSVPESKRKLYAGGVSACNAGHKKAAPLNLNMEDRHWWLAGYSDREIEIAAKSLADEARMLKIKKADATRKAKVAADNRRRVNDGLEQQYIAERTREVWDE